VNYLSRGFSIFLSLAICGTSVAQRTSAAQVQDRISAPITENSTTPIAGSLHSQLASQSDLGRVTSDTQLQRVTLVFKLSAQQQQDLDTLLQQQQDPRSPNYHKWLTPALYHQRFGISDSDLLKVKTWLQSNGLIVNEESSDRSMVVFSGNASQLGRAFHTEMHRFAANGETHIANATDIAIPSALANIVSGVRALNDFKPRSHPNMKQVKSAFTSSISGSHFLSPDDFATIYGLKSLYNGGITGSGQKIAIAGQSDIIVNDIRTFRSVSGLPASDPQVILVPGSGDPGTVNGDVDEAALDLEWSGAVAPGATIVYVNSGRGAFDSLQYAIQQNVAPVISISYGDCEQNFTNSELNTFNALFQQANAQGQTIISASGDSGAADCDYPTSTSSSVTSARHGFAVDYPPSSPNVTAIGGSTFSEGLGSFWNTTNNSSNGSATGYIPEVAWNDTANDVSAGGSLSASGGGASKLFTKPSWQTGVGVPADSARDLPDVTFAASADHDGYLSCSQGSCVNGYRAADSTLTVVGGTSAGSPAFAGIVALLNQKTNSAQGNINPAMYALAATSGDAFHDITLGDNKVPCTSGTTDCPSGGTIGFSAGVGYDQVTGLGSLNVINFVNELSGQAPSNNPDFQLSAANSTMSFARGASSTNTITITALNGFSSNVTLSCSVTSGVTNTICVISPGSVNGSGTATLTLTSSAIASASPLHDHQSTGTPLLASAMFGLCALIFAGKSTKKGVANKAVFSVLLIAMVAIVGAGCGGSTGSTATTTPNNTSSVASGTVIVTGTSGSTSHSIQIAVTVN
jgi:subtilase family serine protease